MLVLGRIWRMMPVILTLCFCSTTASGQGARPVIDLRPDTYPAGSRPRQFVSVGNQTFFMAERYGEGRELWITDGAPAGTRLVKDIAPGLSDIRLDAATKLNGELLFVADDGGHGYELWSSDGTVDGTRRLTDISPGADSGVFAKRLPVLNDFAYFIARDGASPYALWRSSGANGVTELFHAPPASDLGYYVGSVETSYDQLFFFEGHFRKTAGAIYASDGTRGKAVRLLDEVVLGDGLTFQFVQFKEATWFSATKTGQSQLWQTDGTARGTRALAGVPLALRTARLQIIVAHDEFLYFTVNGHTAARQLWRTDGTGAGTRRVADLFPEIDGFGVNDVVTTSAGTYLRLGSSTEQSLWFVRADDGRFFRIVQPDDTRIYPSTMTTMGDDLFFVVAQTARANNVWWVPRGANTMQQLTDFRSRYSAGVAPGDGSRRALHNAGTYLLFAASDGGSGEQLWRSDPRPQTTRLVKNIQSRRGRDGGIEEMVTLEDQLVFVGPSQLSGTAVWRSRGTPQSTERILDFSAYESCFWPSQKRRPQVGGFREWNNEVIFSAYYYETCPAGRSETWVTDGSPEGSKVIAPVGLYGLQPLNGRLVGFSNELPANVWVTDGTTAGSQPLTNLNLEFTQNLAALSETFHGHVYFQIEDFIGETEIWRTDGTPDGTIPLVDLDPILSDASSILRLLGQTEDAVYWMLRRMGEFEIWRLDADGAASPVAQLGRSNGQYFQFGPGRAFGDRLVFSFHDEDGMEPWITDGTTPGTRQIANVGPGDESVDGEGPIGFAELDGQLFFRGNDGVHGTELWRTDGTAQGTYMVRDLFPGALGSLVHFWKIEDGALFLTTRTSATGEELWRFDGLSFTQITEILPGSQGVPIRGLRKAKDKTYFTVDDGVIGRELWVLDESMPVQ